MKENCSQTEATTRGVLCKKGVLRNFTKFTGKHLCQSLFFSKVAVSFLVKFQAERLLLTRDLQKTVCISFKSILWQVFYKIDVLRIYTTFTGKNLRPTVFFNKVAGLKAATLLKKWFRHRCFPVNSIDVFL